MVALRPAVIGAVIRKDFTSLWRLVIGASFLPLFILADRVIRLPQPLQALMVVIGAFATGALAVTVFHQDAAPSLRHDWKTRPIGPLNLIVAKVVFLFLFLGLPIFATQFARELLQDHSVGEALLSSLFILTTAALAVAPIVVLGLVTSNVIETFVMMFLFLILGLLAVVFLPRPEGARGASWVIEMSSMLVAAIFIVAVTLLLFRRKAPGLARLTYFAGFVLSSVGMTFMPGTAAVAVAVQQAIGSDAPQAKRLVTKIEGFCSRKGGGSYNFQRLPERYLKADMAVAGQPAGWQVAVDHIRAQYLDDSGKAQERVSARAAEAGPPSAKGNIWTLEAPARPGAADGGKMRWIYALTLLEPVRSQELVADGKRRYLPGFGYCSSDWDNRGEVNVHCLKPFAQPAAISTEVVGKPQTFNLTSTPISYKPAIFEGFGDYRQGSPRPQGIGKVLSPPQVLRLTAYAPRAHVLREMTTVLPEAAPACGEPSKSPLARPA